jgi:hypothetical protein
MKYDSKYFIIFAILKLFDASSLIMDVSDLARLTQVIVAHQDPYVFGHYAGKFAKLLTQAYMSGLIDLIIKIVYFFVDD